jgi:hypothetical protein
MWWMRIWEADRKDYGRWVPTGCANLEDAKFYAEVNYGINLRQVKEWLLCP